MLFCFTDLTDWTEGSPERDWAGRLVIGLSLDGLFSLFSKNGSHGGSKMGVLFICH